MMNTFSVLLSIYSKESSDNFRLSLESIFHQTILPQEVVLVKDGPLTTELDQVITDYLELYPSQLKIVKLPQNVGLGKALNFGLEHCSNELVARMDTDDIAKPDRFEKQLAIFHKHPEIDVCSAWIDEFEGDIASVKSVRKLPELHQDIVNFAKSRNPISHPVVMFKKSTVLSAGGYQHCPLFEDYHLWVRMIMNEACFYNIQESLLYFRFSPDMFKRRGGLKYAIDELRFQKFMYHVGFISLSQFVKNVLIRFTTRIMPNNLRSFIYKNLLRK